MRLSERVQEARQVRLQLEAEMGPQAHHDALRPVYDALTMYVRKGSRAEVEVRLVDWDCKLVIADRPVLSVGWQPPRVSPCIAMAPAASVTGAGAG